MEYLKEQLPGLDFAEEIAANPELESYIIEECKKYEMEYRDPLESPDAPKLDDNFSQFFLLCGLPKVDQAKSVKLSNVLGKIFTKLKVDFVKTDKITMLMNESTNMSYGTAFIECNDAKEAKLASTAIHGFALDKKHTIMSSTFDEFERLIKVPDEYNEPKFADLLDLYSYALDQSNDQFMVRENDEIIVKMNKIPTKADATADDPEFHDVLVGPGQEKRIKTKANSHWSPQGRFLVVFQSNMVHLYGGSSFDLIREIIHTGASFARVSPCERYIVTYSKTADANEGNYVFWNIYTGELLRKFSFDDNTPKNSPADIFSFSYDGRFCAKLIPDHVVVYDLPDMVMNEDRDIQKRVGIRIDGIKSFQWSPSQPIFCYWMNDERFENQAPKIGFIEMPNRRLLSEREINNGHDLKLKWSGDGDKLITLNKLKVKKAYYNSVGIFDVTNRSIPLDLIKCDYNVLSAQWNPSTRRLAILVDRSKKIHENWVEKSAISIACIYDVTEENGTLKSTFIGAGKEHISNTVEWAKNGNIFVVADSNNKNAAYQGLFYVYYIRTVISKVEKQVTESTVPGAPKPKKAKGKKAKPQFEEVRTYNIELLTTIEDNRADTISWDSTSRFFITGKLTKNIMNTQNMSFKIHNAIGDQIYSFSSAKLQQFAWRPRPHRHWTEEQEKAFKKELKKTLRKKIVTQDKEQKDEVLELFNIEKEAKMKAFAEIFAPLHKRYRDTKKQRKAILKSAYPDSDSENDEEFERTVVIDYKAV